MAGFIINQIPLHKIFSPRLCRSGPTNLIGSENNVSDEGGKVPLTQGWYMFIVCYICGSFYGLRLIKVEGPKIEELNEYLLSMKFDSYYDDNLLQPEVGESVAAHS